MKTEEAIKNRKFERGSERTSFCMQFELLFPIKWLILPVKIIVIPNETTAKTK